MSDKHKSSSFKSIFATSFRYVGNFSITLFSGVVLAIIIQDARFDPQRSQNPSAQQNSSTEAAKLSTSAKESIFQENIQNPSSISVQIPKPDLTISGQWEGRYTCSKQVIGVTLAIAQSGNKVIAEFTLGPVPENPIIPRGLAKYEGDFHPISRRMSFPRGAWINQPTLFWTAFGFQGQFDEKLETFSGKMEHHSCTAIDLKRKMT